MSQTMEGGAMRGRRLAAIFGGFALCVGAVVVCLQDSGAGGHLSNPNHHANLHVDDCVAGYVCIEHEWTSARACLEEGRSQIPLALRARQAPSPKPLNKP
jgi:hypothetical protein